MIERNTIQRSLVFEAVNKLRCHPTADEVYDLIVQNHANISKATVYRNLNHLSQMGRIQKIEIPGGPDRFDYRCDAHYHIRCDKCGKVFDVDMECITDLKERIKDSHGFLLTGCDVFFWGICPECGT